MTLTALITFAGGIGLFLLGMRLMSDGLKVAAGSALRDLLARATGSPLRALGSGALITALVQSSSAVIFATIGFVNAGLLTLAQAVGVIVGANLGTTLTSWIVAVAGFNIDLRVLAMPAIALGMGAWIGGRGRGIALGQALVGFGVFFLGLDVLKGAFAGADALFALTTQAGEGVAQILLFTGVGIVLTLLMQSSSAALAVTLTAAAGGMLPLPAAAAMVIGANVGTTSTAVFATLGATAAARRTAAAHVVFNLVAATASLIVLPWILALAMVLADALGLGDQPPSVLALVHTMSNLLGVVLIWPFMNPLVGFLEARFVRREIDPAVPRHLDDTVLATPRLAIDALALELARIGATAHQMARTALNHAASAHDLAADDAVIEALGEAAIGFTSAVNSGGDAFIDNALPDAVRVVQYCRGVADSALDLAANPASGTLPESLATQLEDLRDAANQVLTASDPAPGRVPDESAIAHAVDAFERSYPTIKAELLRAGSRATVSAGILVRELDRISATRRLVDQAGKAGRFLARLTPAPTAT